MPDLTPLHDEPPPELSALEAQLAMDEVIAEMSNPQGLRLDSPVVDPVTAYKAHLREVLAGHPQTLETQAAASLVMAEEFTVPPAETVDVEVPPPEPEPPELVELQPATSSNQVVDVAVTFLGGPFGELAEIMADDTAQVTQFIDENRLAARLRPTTVDAAYTVDCYVRQGGDETAHLPFEFTMEEPPPPPPQEELENQPTASAGAVVEGA